MISFGNIFSRNSINNALVTVEVPRLVERLREVFSSNNGLTSSQTIEEPSRNHESLDSPPPAPQISPLSEKTLTRRTGWHFTWDVGSSTVTVREGKGGSTWTQSVGALPPVRSISLSVLQVYNNPILWLTVSCIHPSISSLLEYTNNVNDRMYKRSSLEAGLRDGSRKRSNWRPNLLTRNSLCLSAFLQSGSIIILRKRAPEISGRKFASLSARRPTKL